MSIPDPNLPAPQSLDDCIALLRIGGVEAIRPAVQWIEAHAPTLHPRTVAKAHRLLNEAGYLLEEALGVPDDYFGAGGTGKP